MPMPAPIKFPKSDQEEKKDAPKIVGIYPPTKEPMIMPNITKVFEDTRFLYKSTVL